MKNKLQNLFHCTGGTSCPAWVALALLALFAFDFQLSTARAQGTAFTYQGQLNSDGSPANGSYDFTFALFDNSGTNSGQIGGTLTNLKVGVTNGLFTVPLDFGGVFAGNATWLAIGVRAVGETNFTGLSPSQQLTASPFAVFANTASNLSGTLPSSQINGTYTGVVTFSNTANSFFGAFSGNGGGLADINASNLTGTIASSNLPPAIVTNTETGVTLSLTNSMFSGITPGSGTMVFGTNVPCNYVYPGFGQTFDMNFYGPSSGGAAETGGILMYNDQGVSMILSPNSGAIVLQGFITLGFSSGGWQDQLSFSDMFLTTQDTENGFDWQVQSPLMNVQRVFVPIDSSNNMTNSMYPNGAVTWLLSGQGFASITRRQAYDGTLGIQLILGDDYSSTNFGLNNHNGVLSIGQVTNSGINAGMVGTNAVTLDTHGNVSISGKITGNGSGLTNTFSPISSPDLRIAPTGVTNIGSRFAIAMLTATSATFYISNSVGVAVGTNTSVTGTFPITLSPGGCIHAASGLSGYLYYP